MRYRSLLVTLLALPLSPFSTHALAADWQQPSPEELKITAEPSAPNAEAIYLYREDITDNKLHMEAVYMRMKILRDEGKKYADVELRGAGQMFSITNVEGRTIHSDGAVVPFTGKPYEKLLMKTKTQQYKALVFSLPDVQTGSILEYRYKLRYDDRYYVSPVWDVQTALYTRGAHFRYIPTDRAVLSHVDKGAETASIAYSAALPVGAKVTQANGALDLVVQNVPGLPREQFEPPMQAFAYRVRFYYTSKNTAQEYWDAYGKSWSHDIDHFANDSPEIRSTVTELTTGAATPDDKLKRLYDGVMKLENTRYTRDYSQEENRNEGVKRVRTAADVLALRRGSPDELAMLFLALARSAGFHADAMAVVDRDRDFFQPNYLTGGQLDDLIVLVTVDGKERAFDPGSRYATFGQLAWPHQLAGGLREQNGHTAITTSASESYKDTVLQRIADLTLAPDGTVSGNATVILSGQHALLWRHRALEGDKAELNKAFDKEMQTDMPSGLTVKTDHFLGLESEDTTLMARMTLSGSLGAMTGKRIFVPLSIFPASSQNPFTSTHREEPIDLRYPFMERDTITLHLPAGYQVENLPANARVNLPQAAAYGTEVKASGTTLTFTREYVLAKIFYDPKEYEALRGFFDGVATKDRMQVVLHVATEAHSGQ